MAKKQQVETEVFSQIQVDVTQAELDACVAHHLAVLAANIRNPRPADAIIPALVDAIEILKTKVVARDDKLGRGLSQTEPDA